MSVTYLFVPADRPERFAKALASGADQVILDLEDAVRPEAKQAARRAISEADLDWSRVVVRINDATTGAYADDLDWLRHCAAAAILVPKAETVDTLDAVARALGRPADLMPQIETARGLASVERLLSRADCPRAVFGHLDYANDIGAAPEREALAQARGQLVFASRLAGAEPPVDSVTVALDDPATLEDDARHARTLGFGGKLLSHPSQVAPVAGAFAPGAEEIDWARRVVAAVEAGGSGAVRLDGKMIDKPVEDAARRILSRTAD